MRSNLNTVDEVFHLSIHLLLDQTVRGLFKARELRVEIAGEVQIVDHFLREVFTRDQQRNTRWIRREQDTRHMRCGQIAYIHALDLTMRHTPPRIRRRHRRCDFAQVHIVDGFGNIVLLIGFVNRLAQIAHAHSLVLRVLLAKLRE